ncbi:MAG: ATP-dependent helicase [Lachnospira sp.]|nr:ATP-dependent helicase [Lachnospira sp.]
MVLDEAQKNAVEHNKGPAMILAGPGSGKTTVITHRLKQLTESYGVKPEKILVITFTKMAAVQMKERYLGLCGIKTSKITFGTFHAVFFMILRQVYGYKATDIIRTGEQRAMIKMRLMAKGINVQDENGYIHDIMSEIAKVKSGDYDLDTYQATSCETELFKEFYRAYGDMLESERKVDFEDMMVSTLEVLKERPEVLSQWQNFYEYILVDEFQDASPVQFEIVKLLGAKHMNIFVVGDDDQSIYGFRGAAPDVMKAFEKEYRDVKIYHLNINYRCSGNIVKAATSIINKNSNRFYKDLRAYNEAGEKVRIVRCGSMEEQNEKIAAMLQDIIRNTEDNVAVLTRTHFQSRDIILMLEKKGIKFALGKHRENIYSHWIAVDIEAYIKIAMGSHDRGDYLRIINKPIRYIDRMFFRSPIVEPKQIVQDMDSVSQSNVKIIFEEFMNDINMIRNMPPFAGFNYILKKMGYEIYLKEYAKENAVKFEELQCVVEQLAESFKVSATYDMWLEKVSLGLREMNHKESASKEGILERIVFNTMHGAKGLEYDRVIIPDVSEGIAPYSKALSEDALEEERRLFYVAMTRARKELTITYADIRHNKYVQPSRYVRELHHSKSCV